MFCDVAQARRRQWLDDDILPRDLSPPTLDEYPPGKGRLPGPMMAGDLKGVRTSAVKIGGGPLDKIITSAERRRRWRLEEKLRIVAEVEHPGASFADVAYRDEVRRKVLWNLRHTQSSPAIRGQPA